MQRIQPVQIAGWQGRLIDVRTVSEYANERLARAESVPFDHLAIMASKWERDEPVLVLCQRGIRAEQAGRELRQLGFEHVSIVDGGLDACKNAGIEVVVARSRMGLMRQAMVVAGVLLLIGLVLALAVSPRFIILDWVVACGLIVAGLTGYCPTIKLLERMPWNASSSCKTGTCKP